MATDGRRIRGRLSGEPRDYYVTPGSGDAKLSRFHISQAVRIGNLIEISGQSGADAEGGFSADLGTQIRQAVANVADVLQHAGAEWGDVYSVTSYHVVDDPAAPSLNPDAVAIMADFFRNALLSRPPLWTAVPVPVLAHPGMNVEIAVRAAL